MAQAIHNVALVRPHQSPTTREQEDLLAYGKQPVEKLGTRYRPHGRKSMDLT